jgi:hypothetical protein
MASTARLGAAQSHAQDDVVHSEHGGTLRGVMGLGSVWTAPTRGPPQTEGPAGAAC